MVTSSTVLLRNHLIINYLQYMLPQPEFKSLYKRRLALCYYPELLPKSAVEKLKSEVYGCPELVAELEKTHFQWSKWALTPRQLGLILYYLGDPKIPIVR